MAKRTKFRHNGRQRLSLLNQDLEIEMLCLVHFLEIDKKTLCGAFQRDAAVSEKLFYLFIWPNYSLIGTSIVATIVMSHTY